MYAGFLKVGFLAPPKPNLKNFAQENIQNIPKMFHKKRKNMQQKKTCKTGNVHDFSVCVYTSQDFAQTQ